MNRATPRANEGRHEQASDDLRRAIALKPDRYQAHVDLALLDKKVRHYEEARKHLETAIGLDPPGLVLTTLHAEQAHLLLLMGKPAEALRATDDRLKVEPDAAEVLGVRAAALLELRRFEESVAEFTRCLSLRPGSARLADIFRGRGQARMKLKEYAGAVDDYTKVLGLHTDWEILNHRGWAFSFAEAHQLALRDFEAALDLNPSSLEALIGRGLARVALGRDAEAIKDAEDALGRTCEDPAMLHNIACIFGRAAGRGDPTGQYPGRAVSALRRALDRLPADQRRPFWDETVLTDDYLDAIRGSTEFRELKQQVERDYPSATPRSARTGDR